MLIGKDHPSAEKPAAIIDQAVVHCTEHIHIQLCKIQSKKLHAPLIGLIKIDAFPFRNRISSSAFTFLLTSNS